MIDADREALVKRWSLDGGYVVTLRVASASKPTQHLRGELSWRPSVPAWLTAEEHAELLGGCSDAAATTQRALGASLHVPGIHEHAIRAPHEDAGQLQVHGLTNRGAR